MTKEKAIDILSEAFSSVFHEIESELEAKKVGIEQEVLMSHDLEEIKSLVEELNTIDTALRDIDHCKDAVNVCITDKDKWHSRHLLSDLNKAFSLLPPKDEAN